MASDRKGNTHTAQTFQVPHTVPTGLATMGTRGVNPIRAPVLPGHPRASTARPQGLSLKALLWSELEFLIVKRQAGSSWGLSQSMTLQRQKEGRAHTSVCLGAGGTGGHRYKQVGTDKYTFER